MIEIDLFLVDVSKTEHLEKFDTVERYCYPQEALPMRDIVVPPEFSSSPSSLSGDTRRTLQSTPGTSLVQRCQILHNRLSCYEDEKGLELEYLKASPVR